MEFFYKYRHLAINFKECVRPVNENIAASITRVKTMKNIREFEPFFGLQSLGFITVKMSDNG